MYKDEPMQTAKEPVHNEFASKIAQGILDYSPEQQNEIIDTIKSCIIERRKAMIEHTAKELEGLQHSLNSLIKGD